MDGNTLLLIDQRRLPDVLVEHPCDSAAAVAHAIRQMIVRGAPAIGQAAAIGLALTACRVRNTKPYARRATLRGASNALINARPTAVNLRWAVDRVMARYEEIGELSEDGEVIAAALRAEADAIVFEATTDHGRLAEFGLAALPVPVDRPLRILTHCNTGPLACGQFGTALGVVQAAHHAGREIEVWVDETRPYLQGSRLTAWELQQAGVPHTLIPDVAAGIPDARRRGRRRARRRGPDRGQRRHREQGRHVPAGRARGAPRHPVLRLCAAQLGRPRHAGRRRDPDRGARRRGGPRVPRHPDRAGRNGRAQPRLRRHPGRAHHGRRHGGGPADARRSSPPSGPPRNGRASAGQPRLARARNPSDGHGRTRPARLGRRPDDHGPRAAARRSSSGTGCTPPTRCATSRTASSGARSGGSRRTATTSSRSSSSTAG